MNEFIRNLRLFLAGVISLKDKDYIIPNVVTSEDDDLDDSLDDNLQPSGKWTPFVGPIEIPENRREVYRVFGNPGTGKVDKKWEREAMTIARNLPGEWNAGTGKLYCHRLAEPYIREALRRCEVKGVLHEIRRFGCWNFRHQRHDSARPLSYHSWGIAVDINPQDNKGLYRSKYNISEPFTGNWRKIYPDGVSEKLVDCFESVGFSWGGRWDRYVDGMHFQLVA